MSKERDVSLDAMRGLAALAVFGWHAMLAFYPASSGYLDATPIAETARSRFWFFAVHGAGAVAFFFVLSGFVLTRLAMTSGDTDPLLRGLIKRWPRLAGPTLAATLGSWLLFALGAYFYAPAAALTGSSWFAHFGGALAGVAPFQPSLGAAALQGAALTFLRGDSTYDSSLWTMSFEFYGSLMVYGLAFLLAPRPATRLRLIVIGAAAAICGAANPALFPFIVGLGLATFLPREAWRMPAALGAIVVALALLACGYTPGALGIYAPLTAIWPTELPVPFLHVAGAAALIATAESWPGMRALLSRPWGRICGELSFPFYLVHLPILCSAGAYVFLASGSAPAAIVVTLVVSLAVGWLLALASRWWLAKLNVGVAALLANRRQTELGSVASSP